MAEKRGTKTIFPLVLFSSFVVLACSNSAREASVVCTTRRERFDAFCHFDFSVVSRIYFVDLTRLIFTSDSFDWTSEQNEKK